MAILKIKPSCKDYLWGGTRLMTEVGKEYDGDKLAETCELSCHPDGPSYVANGEYAGETLSEYILMEGKKVTGTHSRHYSQFPLLIKFIDAKDDLSIQVHPDDEYAMKNEGQYGKTEMWYIVDCEEGASLYYGFSREVSKEEFEERIKNKTLLEVLNKVEVHKGDVLFIEPGTIHAIGKGNLIAEIQENSNVTYRVYDYGRKDANGKERDLHIEKALQVTKRVPILRKKSFEPHIVDCDYFTVDKVVLDGQRMKKIFGEIDKTSFASLLVLPKHLGFMSGDTEKQNYDRMKNGVMEEVRRMFKPEFLNRIDEIMVFHSLNKENIRKIVTILLKNLEKRCQEQLNITLKITGAAKDLIADAGFDSKYGARPLRRAIQTKIEDEMAAEILAGKIKSGDTVQVKAKDKKICFSVTVSGE